MSILRSLYQKWTKIDQPFLISDDKYLRFDDLIGARAADLSEIKSGDVVAIIGDFDAVSILNLLYLIDMKCIIVPLTKDTIADHDYFFSTALVDFVVEDTSVVRISHNNNHSLIASLRKKRSAGLILFSTGTTGQPKAILHDLGQFLKRYETPRPSLKTLAFLLFDHIGGINTLMHTLFNNGTVVATKSRQPEAVLNLCAEYGVEVLPTTPTFLRLMLMGGQIPGSMPDCLRIITYGTERMDQPTLDALVNALPDVDFRQTYGMSELGILRVKSDARNSLFMRIGGEGVQTRINKGVLQIKSPTRMLGYLNAESPFDKDGWYDTGDVIEERNGSYKIVGRTSEIINVGGLKFMASMVERVALEFPDVELAKATGKPNPVTGEHVELTVQAAKNGAINKIALKDFLKTRLSGHMVPRRINVSEVKVGHRFKKQ